MPSSYSTRCFLNNQLVSARKYRARQAPYWYPMVSLSLFLVGADDSSRNLPACLMRECLVPRYRGCSRARKSRDVRAMAVAASVSCSLKVAAAVAARVGGRWERLSEAESGGERRGRERRRGSGCWGPGREQEEGSGSLAGALDFKMAASETRGQGKLQCPFPIKIGPEINARTSSFAMSTAVDRGPEECWTGVRCFAM